MTHSSTCTRCQWCPSCGIKETACVQKLMASLAEVATAMIEALDAEAVGAVRVGLVELRAMCVSVDLNAPDKNGQAGDG